MSRPLRIEYSGAYYHVMNRGRGRQRIYRGQADYRRFLALVEETCQMWGVRVHAYSFLPNHYHLLLETPRGNLSRALRHLDGVYTQRYNRAHHTDGPLFRGRYKAIVVDAESYLLQVLRYIHLNPVEAEMVPDVRRHPWTSHRHYLGEGKRPKGLVIEEVLGRFDRRADRAVKLYEEFIREGVDDETREVYERKKWPAVWGREAFWEKIRKRVEGKKVDYEIPEMKHRRGRPTLREIEHEVLKRYRIRQNELVKKRRGTWNEPRNVAMYLGRMVGGYPLKELGARWGGLEYSSVSSMVNAVRRLAQKDGGFRRRVEGIERNLFKRQT